MTPDDPIPETPPASSVRPPPIPSAAMPVILPPLPIPPFRRSRKRVVWIIGGVVVLLIVAAIPVALLVERRFRKLPPRVDVPLSADFTEAAGAFGSPLGSPVTGDLPADDVEAIKVLFTRFTRACAADDTIALNTLFDAERMTQELERLPGLPKMNQKERRAFSGSFAGHYLGGVASNSAFDDPCELKHARRLETPDDLVVYVRFRGEFDTRTRFWLHKSDRWRFYDLESLENVARTSTMVSDRLALPESAHAPADSARTQIQQAGSELDAGQFDQAEKTLAGINPSAATPVMRVLYHSYRARLLLNRDQPRHALAELAKADAITPEVPMILACKAEAYRALFDHESAVRALQREIELVGPSPLYSNMLQKSLVVLGRRDEAIAAIRAVLTCTHETDDNLVALARLLPPEAQGEIGRWFEKSPFTQDSYRTLCGELEARATTGRALLSVVDVYEKTGGDSTDIAFYRGAGHGLLGQHEESARWFRTLLGSRDKYYGDAVDSRYVGAMERCGKAAQAYDEVSDRKEVLDQVIRSLDETDSSAATAILERHLAAFPTDGNAWHWKANRLRATDPASADTLYLKALESDLPKQRRAQVERDFTSNRYAQGKGLSAYEALGGAQRFSQLAWLCFEDNDVAQLSQLIDLHAAKHAGDPLVTGWRAQLHYLRAEYIAAAGLYRKYLASKGNSGSYLPADDYLVRSLIRAGLPREALDAALAEKYPSQFGVLLARVALGDVDEAITAAKAYLDDDGDIEEFYDDPDLADRLQSPAFAPFRAAFPRPTTQPATAPTE